MAQQYIASDGSNLVIPGSYVSYSVQAGVSALGVSGVITLVGEANGGPDFTKESKLAQNSFGPDSLSDVIAKYGTGRLVDAFRGAVSAANDPAIKGAFTRAILVKTNPSGKASAALPKNGGGTYATLADTSYGTLGNLIYFTVTAKQPEVMPILGPFTFIPPVSTANISLRVNGGAEETVSVTPDMTPAAFQGAVGGLSGVSCTGGTSRQLVTVSGTIAVSVASNVATVTWSVSNWNIAPVVGDTLSIPMGSAIAGAGDANVGAYVVTGVTADTVTATKLSDAGKSGAVAGTITAPVAVSATAVLAITDVVSYAPITITLSNTTILDGIGKDLEFNQLTTGTDLIARCCFVLGTTTPVTFISKIGTPVLNVSSAEYIALLTVNRQVDNINALISGGGQIALQIGYTGTTCAVIVTATTLSTTVAGGSGVNLSLNLAQFTTINDLAAYINAQPGYTASVGVAALGQLPSIALDEVTATAGTTFGAQTLRLKVDAVKFFQAISNNTNVVQLGIVPTQALAGQPALTSGPVYLAGGTLGGTTDAIYQAAIDACKSIQTNFVVPLFSQDATADIAIGQTDPSSTYDILTINTYARQHVNQMSTLKRKRNRQAFLSVRNTFLNDQTSAANIAAARCSMTFQDVNDIGSNGVQQFQPWMAAVKAAGMQAAGFYQSIFNKGVDISGVLQAAGDYNDQNDDNEETALESGLLPLKLGADGSFTFISDQTTYLTDSNFVYNSIQAIYAADQVALGTAQSMQKAFVGKSVADVTAASALTAFQAIMATYLRLKLIAPSDGAEKGYRNVVIRINGPVMTVSAELFLATSLYFIPISFQINQVTNSATSVGT